MDGKHNRMRSSNLQFCEACLCMEEMAIQRQTIIDEVKRRESP